MSSGIVITTMRAFVRHDDESFAVLYRGDALPSNLADGERERLANAGALGRRASDTPTDQDEDTTPFDVLGSTPESLVTHLEAGNDGKPLNGSDAVALADDDDTQVAADKARLVITAENTRAADAGTDARGNVIGPLVKLIEAAGSADSQTETNA